MQVCRICLALDRTTYPFDSSCIRLYQQITGLTIVQADLLPKSVCWECKDYMFIYDEFKSRAVAGYCILIDILNKDGVITESSIKAASLNDHKPTSTCTEVGNLSIDSQFKKNLVGNEDDYPESEIKIETEPDYSDNFIKTEAKDEFVNVCDSLITAKEEFIVPEATADVDIIHDATSDVGTTPEATADVGTSPEATSDVGIIHDTTADVEIIHDATADFGIIHDATSDVGTIPESTADVKSKVSDDPLSNLLIELVPKNVKKNDDTKIKSLLEVIDRDLFDIIELNTMNEQIAELQCRKASVNYKKSPHKCENCFKGFKDDAAYQRHMEKHAESCGRLVCTLCKLRYTSMDFLKRHMKTHRHKLHCKKCKFTANTYYSAYKHQKYHQGEKYECKFCNNTFSHRTTYLSHVRVKHPIDVPCKYCGHSFRNKTGLMKHLKSAHGAMNSVSLDDGPLCARCDIRFSCQDALDTHRRVSARHADEREATAHDQGDSTEDKKEETTKDSTENKKKRLRRNSSKEETTIRIKKRVRKRVRTKSPTSRPFPDGPVPCEQCGEKVASPQAYHIHFKTTHKGVTRTQFFYKEPNNHMCEVCGLRFRYESALHDHSFAHSTTKQFKCERCGKLFQREYYLQYHQKRHCGNRVDHPCGVCGKSFVTKPNLQRHMLIHQGLEYKCELCERVFNCCHNRQTHMRRVHNKERKISGKKPAENQMETVQEQEPYVEIKIEED